MLNQLTQTQKIFYALISSIPLYYSLGSLTGNNYLYSMKDIIFLLIFFIVFVNLKISKNAWLLFGLFVLLSIYGLFLTTNSFVLYILSVREVLFYPLVGILLGYYFSKNNGVEVLYSISIVYLILTYIFLILFPTYSFGPTDRLHSLWDREHEPAIIAGLCILGTVYLAERNIKSLFIFLASIYVITLTGSRSAIIGILFAFLILSILEFSVMKIIFIFILAVIIMLFFAEINTSGRALDHNLIARINQYQLAIDTIQKSHFLGIGPDKYGVMSGIVEKEYCNNGLCTKTMDSTIIKYLVNYGLIYLFTILIIILMCIKCFFKFSGRPDVKYLLSLVLFSLVIGSVTGKLGAFPLNMFFYYALGCVLSILSFNKAFK